MRLSLSTLFNCGAVNLARRTRKPSKEFENFCFEIFQNIKDQNKTLGDLEVFQKSLRIVELYFAYSIAKLLKKEQKEI